MNVQNAMMLIETRKRLKAIKQDIAKIEAMPYKDMVKYKHLHNELDYHLNVLGLIS